MECIAAVVEVSFWIFPPFKFWLKFLLIWINNINLSTRSSLALVYSFPSEQYIPLSARSFSTFSFIPFIFFKRFLIREYLNSLRQAIWTWYEKFYHSRDEKSLENVFYLLYFCLDDRISFSMLILISCNIQMILHNITIKYLLNY